ncbi:MAG: hypothetical protein ACYS0C_04440 [Planctomycetota bacterium]
MRIYGDIAGDWWGCLPISWVIARIVHSLDKWNWLVGQVWNLEVCRCSYQAVLLFAGILL